MWTTEELGTGTWMTSGDMAKLRKNYQCDGRKLIFQILHPPPRDHFSLKIDLGHQTIGKCVQES